MIAGRSRRKKRGFAVTAHRRVSLVLGVFVVLYALSGVVLNHRAAFARFHVSRAWLPREFRYHNWNNAAVKGAVDVGADGILLYGNIGAWRAEADCSNARECNRGLPAGADRRQLERVFLTAQGDILAGTRYGLYRLDEATDTWRAVPLHVEAPHVVDLAQKGDRLYVLTRSQVLAGPAARLDALRPLDLQPPPDWDGKARLFRLIWQIHSGELFGLPGRLVVDLLAAAFVLLAFTGAALFHGPKWIRRRNRAGKRALRTAGLVRVSRRWHRRVGIWMALFLLAGTLLGMFLRPPFLLAIVRKRVAAWPGTTLRNAGPWHDRLRRLHYDSRQDRFVLSTADGFYVLDGSMEAQPRQPACEPPVSVMGLKVLESHDDGGYLVGSFMGLYRWAPEQGVVVNWMTKGAPPPERARLPFGRDMVSGYLRDKAGRGYVFDYRRGAMPVGHAEAFPAMPDPARKSPISLWTLALETHTGRLYRCFLGWGQLLWVALSGLGIVVILVTGVIWWRRPRPGRMK